MTNESTIAVVTAVAFLSRLWSSFEHKKTARDVGDIRIYFNGEMERRLEEAKEQGRQEERNKNLKNTL